MKKLLVLLLALVIPICASAESFGFSLSINTSGDYFHNGLTTTLMDYAEMDEAAAEVLSSLVQSFVNGFKMDCTFQENAYAASFEISGTKFADVIACETPDKKYFSTSLLPGYVFTDSNAEATVVSDSNWDKIVDVIVASVARWIEGLESDTLQGVFAGDAFTGGSVCTTWTFDHQDISILAASVMNDEACTSVIEQYAAEGLSVSDMVGWVLDYNDSVAKDNRYEYLFRIVQDQHELIGFSLTILQDTLQVATLSMGVQEDAIAFVLGLGFDQENYWCEVLYKGQQEKQTAVRVLEVREWSAEKDKAFAVVKHTSTPANHFEFQLEVESMPDNRKWAGYMHANGVVFACGEGIYDMQNKALEGLAKFRDGKNDILSIAFSAGVIDTIPALDTSLLECSISAQEDKKLYEELVQQLSLALVTKCLKILPADQLVQLFDFTMPR